MRDGAQALRGRVCIRSDGESERELYFLKAKYCLRDVVRDASVLGRAAFSAYFLESCSYVYVLSVVLIGLKVDDVGFGDAVEELFLSRVAGEEYALTARGAIGCK